MVLLGVAWLPLVLGLRWQLRTKAVTAVPGLATLAVALVGALGFWGLTSPVAYALIRGELIRICFNRAAAATSHHYLVGLYLIQNGFNQRWFNADG